MRKCCSGTAFEDTCGVCSSGTTDRIADSDIDCNSICFGEALIDDCGVCSGGDTGIEFNSDKDCAGVCDGDAEILDYCYDSDGDGIGSGESYAFVVLVEDEWSLSCTDSNDEIFANQIRLIDVYVMEMDM